MVKIFNFYFFKRDAGGPLVGNGMLIGIITGRVLGGPGTDSPGIDLHENVTFYENFIIQNTAPLNPEVERD